MKVYSLAFALAYLLIPICVNGNNVHVTKSDQGFKLVVDGKDFMIKGMNWDYYPIGTNYEYSLWSQPEEVIKSVLNKEMTLLRDMGVNALRIYTGIPKEWITYIHKNFGIYTMLNHPYGRYGVSVKGEWMTNTEYNDPEVRELLLNEAKFLAKEYRDTPGLLLYLLGNENNYGLFWDDTPKKPYTKEGSNSALQTRAMYKLFLLNHDKQKSKEEANDEVSTEQKSEFRARSMYKLFNEAALAIKSLDSSHPIAICNGDLMFIDIIKDECRDVDIFGTNMYRGVSFGDSFERVKQALDMPIMLTEFGADAYNAMKNTEDQESQAYYLIGNWKEIYANAAGIGGSGNSIGGFTYQFSDGWWKADQVKNLDVHDITASWNNGGYYTDDNDGKDNMNEEWFGICAKVNPDFKGAYDLMPRASYFALKRAHAFLPYDPRTTLIELQEYFSSIQISEAIKESKVYSNSLIKN